MPISDVNANAYLTQNNVITISALALLQTAQQANLTAQMQATGNMVAYAEGVSWATEAANGILEALGGGGATVHGGNSDNSTYATITNNGTIKTGINSHLTLTLINNPSFNPSDPNSQAVIAAVGLVAVGDVHRGHADPGEPAGHRTGVRRRTAGACTGRTTPRWPVTTQAK